MSLYLTDVYNYVTVGLQFDFCYLLRRLQRGYYMCVSVLSIITTERLRGVYDYVTYFTQYISLIRISTFLCAASAYNNNRFLAVTWCWIRIQDHFSTSLTAAEYGLLQDLLPFLMQSLATVHETLRYD